MLPSGPRAAHRKAARYRHIISVFAKHGVGYLADAAGLSGFTRRRPALKRISDELSSAERRRAARIGLRLKAIAEDLGPAFIKLGQMLSMRPDLLPPDILQPLRTLQDHVRPFEFSAAKELIQRELGAPVEALFAEIEEEPIGSASMAQVHRGKSLSGLDVAVKVLRPGIEEVVETDLAILLDVARFLQSNLRAVAGLPLVGIVDELAKAIRMEMDFRLEAYNAEKLRASCRAEEVAIPRVLWDLTSKRVLTLEFLPGTRLSDLNGEHPGVAKKLVRAWMRQVLVDGVFHADPHPGNVLVCPDGRLGFADFGLVGTLSEGQRANLARVLWGMATGKTDRVVEGLEGLGVSGDLSGKGFRESLDSLFRKYSGEPLGEIPIGEVVDDVLRLVARYHLKVPRELTLAGRALGVLEGTVRGLDPRVKIQDVVDELAPEMLRENAIGMAAASLRDLAREYVELVKHAPRLVRGVMQNLERGKISLGFNGEDIEKLNRRLDRIANRLSFSVLVLAFCILMAGLTVSSSLGAGINPPGLFWRVPILEIGFVIAGAMFVGLLWSIARSGRL